MKLYADLPSRRTAQVIGDVLLVVWVLVWLRLSAEVHRATERLAVPGHRVDASASDLADQFHHAADSLDGLPVVGAGASRPFDGAASAADQLAAAGRTQVAAVDSLAFWLSLAIALVPILLALAFYVPARLRFVRRATAGQGFLDAEADLDLFALRALANQPLHVLARISDDPAGRWRDRDPAVVHRLAALELRDVGLVLPSGL
jgi:hypothetical protein